MYDEFSSDDVTPFIRHSREVKRFDPVPAPPSSPSLPPSEERYGPEFWERLMREPSVHINGVPGMKSSYPAWRTNCDYPGLPVPSLELLPSPSELCRSKKKKKKSESGYDRRGESVQHYIQELKRKQSDIDKLNKCVTITAEDPSGRTGSDVDTRSRTPPPVNKRGELVLECHVTIDHHNTASGELGRSKGIPYFRLKAMKWGGRSTSELEVKEEVSMEETSTEPRCQQESFTDFFETGRQESPFLDLSPQNSTSGVVFPWMTLGDDVNFSFMDNRVEDWQAAGGIFF